jgi:hypothetical protein
MLVDGVGDDVALMLGDGVADDVELTLTVADDVAVSLADALTLVDGVADDVALLEAVIDAVALGLAEAVADDVAVSLAEDVSDDEDVTDDDSLADAVSDGVGDGVREREAGDDSEALALLDSLSEAVRDGVADSDTVVDGVVDGDAVTDTVGDTEAVNDGVDDGSGVAVGVTDAVVEGKGTGHSERSASSVHRKPKFPTATPMPSTTTAPHSHTMSAYGLVAAHTPAPAPVYAPAGSIEVNMYDGYAPPAVKEHVAVLPSLLDATMSDKVHSDVGHCTTPAATTKASHPDCPLAPTKPPDLPHEVNDAVEGCGGVTEGESERPRRDRQEKRQEDVW